ncbi:helix-turn-helix domain-containing protein [Aurantimonas sp. MSK8Z-1]|uniref:helix-turn-helix domain-containing protein n=1 Tax=Mangrovibrevibacter kandeliae TaxID=2968473 RepID=UPI002119A29B|nr:helix-turn-helix transcriptional regulator [Aurantimonas sp. MSK8Z-1]MCW4117030.1 helix-turn-helix domain-containing protein [Aurantimonas sp. MSK8Z-1]
MGLDRKLRERRQKLGKTQDQVARDAGMHVTQYNGYERGRSTPASATLVRIAVALETSVQALIDTDEDPPASEDVLLRIRQDFCARVAAELGLPPENGAVRIELV